MKTVAIVSGLVHQPKYNQHLTSYYKQLGFASKEFKFDPLILFRCKQHHRLASKVKEIVHDNDVIHCQSGGFFPVIHHYYEHQHTKPFILETPVLRSTPGTLLAAMGIAKSFETAPDIQVIQKLLDIFCFTPEWTQSTIQRLGELQRRGLTLTLASSADNVSDNRGHEHLLDHSFSQGHHARLFYANDFKIIEDFLRSHPSTK